MRTGASAGSCLLLYKLMTDDSRVDLSYNTGSGSVRSNHQTVSDYTLRQWFPNTQQSWCLTAFRRLEKISYTFHFLTQSFHPWWCETCKVVQQHFWMKECDILVKVKTYSLSDPSYIFSQPSGSTPLLTSVVISRPWSRDSSALEFILSRSRSRSRDLKHCC